MMKRKAPDASVKKKKKLARLTADLNTDELRHLRYTYDDRYTCERHFFLKKDASREGVLIVSNVPAYLPEGTVVSFMKQFVPYEIESAVVQRTTASDGSYSQGQLTMSITFNKPEAVVHALQNCQNVGPYVVSDFADTSNVKTVLEASIETYKSIFPSAEQIEKSANEYMQRYDEMQEELKKEARRRFTKPDEDGWVTVTSGAKKSAKPMKLLKKNVPLMGGLPKGNKRENKVDLAFYSFQVKQQKLKKANELLKKFEEDKKRVAQLKQARNFRPF